jgi:glycosyltransferase involved in cell wall biosynthesis
MRLLVITSYPEDNLTHGKKTVGVASYTKNTIKAIQKLNSKVQVTIWSESNKTWQRNSLSSLFKLSLKLTKSNHQHLFLPHEFNMFGSSKTIIFFPIILLINKLKNKPSTLVLHQVVTSFKHIAQHANIPKPFIPVVNMLSKLYYSVIIKLSTSTIVFEEFLKQRLPKNLHKKITVIPHAVENFKTSQSSFNNSNQFNLLTFGYLAHYKGIDWLIKSFKNYLETHPNKNLHLVIAGGPNPNHLNKPHYQKYLKKINQISQHPQIILTGFIKEKDIPKAFSRANLIILPYRIAMSSSGPLSIALSFNKPFAISKSIQKYTRTADFQKALKTNKLNKKDITFTLSQKSFNSIINNFLKDKQLSKKVTQFSRDLNKERSWSKIAKLYNTHLNT